MDKDNVIDMNPEKARDEKIKKRWGLVKKIAMASTWEQLEQAETWKWSAGIGLYQGLKYGGSVSRGLKGSVATVAVMTGARIVTNLVQHKDEIKNI
jgi:hypothetical protein